MQRFPLASDSEENPIFFFSFLLAHIIIRIACNVQYTFTYNIEKENKLNTKMHMTVNDRVFLQQKKVLTHKIINVLPGKK